MMLTFSEWLRQGSNRHISMDMQRLRYNQYCDEYRRAQARHSSSSIESTITDVAIGMAIGSLFSSDDSSSSSSSSDGGSSFSGDGGSFGGGGASGDW